MYEILLQALLITLLIYLNAFLLLSLVLYINFIYKKIALNVNNNKKDNNNTKK